MSKHKVWSYLMCHPVYSKYEIKCKALKFLHLPFFLKQTNANANVNTLEIVIKRENDGGRLCRSLGLLPGCGHVPPEKAATVRLLPGRV